MSVLEWSNESRCLGKGGDCSTEFIHDCGEVGEHNERGIWLVMEALDASARRLYACYGPHTGPFLPGMLHEVDYSFLQKVDMQASHDVRRSCTS
jgi:hypothetical protein